MNPLIDQVTQDYFLLSMEMVRIPVTGSKTKEIVVGLYYKKQDAYRKDIVESGKYADAYIRYKWIVVNNNTGKYCTVNPSYLYPWSNEYPYQTFFEEMQEAIKLTDEEVEDAAFEFDITKSNIEYVYKTFSLKWNEIKKLEQDHPNFIYELAMTDWKYRKYLLVHFEDSVLDFKYEAGVVSVYDNDIKAYVFEDRTPVTNLIFNTDYIKTHFYSTLFDLRKPRLYPEIDPETNLPFYEMDISGTFMKDDNGLPYYRDTEGNLTTVPQYDDETGQFVYAVHPNNTYKLTITPQYDSNGKPKYHMINDYKVYLRDFQRFQYALLELLIQPKLRQYYCADSNLTETFKINDKEVISLSLEADDTVFNPNMYFGKNNFEEYYANRVLTIIDHTEISSDTITHQIFNINLTNSDTTIAPYVLTNFDKTYSPNPTEDAGAGEGYDSDDGPDLDDLDDNSSDTSTINTNNVFLNVDESDSTIVYNTDKLFEFFINRLIRHYFQTEKTFLDDKPRVKNIVTHIPLRY